MAGWPERTTVSVQRPVCPTVLFILARFGCPPRACATRPLDGVASPPAAFARCFEPHLEFGVCRRPRRLRLIRRVRLDRFAAGRPFHGLWGAARGLYGPAVAEPVSLARLTSSAWSTSCSTFPSVPCLARRRGASAGGPLGSVMTQVASLVSARRDSVGCTPSGSGRRCAPWSARRGCRLPGGAHRPLPRTTRTGCAPGRTGRQGLGAGRLRTGQRQQRLPRADAGPAERLQHRDDLRPGARRPGEQRHHPVHLARRRAARRRAAPAGERPPAVAYRRARGP